MAERRAIPVYDYRPTTPLDQCLETWIDSYRHADLDVGCGSSSRHLNSDAPPCSDHLYSNMDNNVAKAVDAEVSSLPMHMRWAIQKCCGITNVWRFQSLDFEKVVVDAKQELENKLKKNLATRIFFV
jgi:hypothetical protein